MRGSHNDMSITVRAAVSEADWQQAMALLYEVYVGEGHSPAERASQTYRREALESEGVLLIAVDQVGDVLGAMILLEPGSTLRQLARAGEREFRLLAVRPSARGSGVGEALVRACIERCVSGGAEALVLWTRPVMTSAQRLYARLGFQRIPDRDEEDPRGFTRMVYRLDLTTVK